MAGSGKHMKILFVHDFYQQFGGEDSAAISERKLLEDNGHELLCYTRHNEEIKSYSFWDKVRFLDRTVYSFQTEHAIQTAVEKFRPTVAFVHNVYPLISPSLYHTLHRLRVPIAQVVHDFRPYCANGWYYVDGQICERCKFGNYLHAISHRCYKDSYLLSALYSGTLFMNRLAGMTDKIDAFICLTGFYKQKMLEVGIPEDKIHIRPNFIDPAEFVPEFSAGNGEYVLFLGRLSSEKGLWTIVRAFEALKDVELRIAGTGPLEAELRNYVNEKNLCNIRFLGFQSGEGKWQTIKNAMFTVVASECYENFPMVILEYFRGGKPVVASNLGGLPYIVEDGKAGLLYRPGDVSDLVDKIRYLLARPAEIKRMGTYGRRLVETRYGPDESYGTLMNIFDRVQAQ